MKCLIENYFEGTGRGLIVIISRNLLEETEENHEKHPPD
jgi:hypothetical protein